VNSLRRPSLEKKSTNNPESLHAPTSTDVAKKIKNNTAIIYVTEQKITKKRKIAKNEQRFDRTGLNDLSPRASPVIKRAYSAQSLQRLRLMLKCIIHAPHQPPNHLSCCWKQKALF
jgi:DNA polymerase III delta prime subunit